MAEDFEIVNRAFSKQASHYDRDDRENSILQRWRRHVYDHVEQFLKPGDRILEINAGTGIDALYFSKRGHSVHATDVSQGMIREIEEKIQAHPATSPFTCQQLSYDELGKLAGRKFNYLFSNFGGLNCIQDLSRVTQHLPSILEPGAFVTWVVMPPFSAMELLGVLEGKRTAFRRLSSHGTVAHLEGEHFRTFYHSLDAIKKSFGPEFQFIKTQGLGALSPAPHSHPRMARNPNLHELLNQIDAIVRNTFPFDRCADHIIVTFQYKGS